MNDCTNAEIRDQLPDLLHDRLTVSVRDVVVAHVADCADCREELELLRGVRVAMLAWANGRRRRQRGDDAVHVHPRRSTIQRASQRTQ